MLTDLQETILQVHFARALAKKEHRGQTDKAGVDYFSGHITHVASEIEKSLNIIQHPAEKPSLYVIVAYLHDIVEDTKITIDDLKVQFKDPKVAFYVDILTRKKSDSYATYIQNVKKHHLTTLVKKADLYHNLDESRYKNPKDHSASLKIRYEKALKELQS